MKNKIYIFIFALFFFALAWPCLASTQRIYNCQFYGAELLQQAEFNPKTSSVALYGYWSINKIDSIAVSSD